MSEPNNPADPEKKQDAAGSEGTPESEPRPETSAPSPADERPTTEIPANQPPSPPPARATPPAAGEPGRARQFFGRRVVQLVGAGLAGLLIGGGAVALLDRDGPGYHHGYDRGKYGKHGHHQFGPGPAGDGPGFDGRRAPNGPAPAPAPAPSSAPAAPAPTT